MSTTRRMFATAAVAIGSSATLLFGGVTGVANADPRAATADRRAAGAGPAGGAGHRARRSSRPPPIPTNAASTLMAAAAVFAG